MVNPILRDPDDAEQELVQTFNEFVSNHWFFNGTVVPKKGPKPTFEVFDEIQHQSGENYD